ncbi:MAG: hypothetical protein GYB66_09575 [Chloroflexi bacterium]|nr:hypothetical protein [Chloroflexota bacterium]
MIARNGIHVKGGKRIFGRLLIAVFIVLALAGCNLRRQTDDASATPATLSASPRPILTNTPFPTPVPASPFVDASYILEDVCYEALLPLAGSSFVLSSRDELVSFLENLDVATRCGRPLTVPSFDFAQQIIIGTVQLATGCDLSLSPRQATQQGQILHIVLALSLIGDCQYDLIGAYVAAIERPEPDERIVITLIQD